MSTGAALLALPGTRHRPVSCLTHASSQKEVLPLLQIDYTGPGRNGAAWHPDGGSLLALPGKDKNVVLYERLSWKVACSLDDEHTEDVNTLAFSPNGELLLAPCGCNDEMTSVVFNLIPPHLSPPMVCVPSTWN